MRPEAALKRKAREQSRDEFKDEVTDGKDRDHRMSRKKRRRLESLKADTEDKANPHAMAPKPMKKEKVLPAFYESGLMSTIGLHRNKKVARPKFAVGGADQDFFSNEDDGKVSKHVIKQLAKEKEFTEFDPEKRLRKGGKMANKSFKSKSKFKRR